MRSFAAGLAAVTAAALAPSLAYAGETQCIVSGKHVSFERVTVTPDHGEAFTTRVDGAAVVATHVAGKPADLAITGAIAFHSTVAHLWYSTTARVEANGGQVVLAPGAHLIGQRAVGGDLIGQAVVYSDGDVGDDRAAEEQIDAVRVRCDQLTLDWEAHDQPEAALGDGTTWSSAGTVTQLLLRSEPRATAAGVTFSSSHCSGTACITVMGIEHRAGWRRVAVRNEGVQATGWVQDKQLTRIPEDVGVGYGYCGCSNARGTVGYGGGAAPRAAHVKVGTQIYAAPRAHPWATVVQADATFQVVPDTGKTGWAELRGIPGIGGDSAVSAYVPVASLTWLP